MKKILLLLLFMSQFSFGQSYTVLNETVGEFMTFTPIYENSDLFGYVELRKMNVDEKNNNTIKYTVLDKNLNIVSSGDFIEKNLQFPTKKENI